MPSEAVDLISRLLDVNESSRLGSGSGGAEDVMAHAFFGGIDWDKLDHKLVHPPIVPPMHDVTANDYPFPDMRSMLAYYHKDHWLAEAPRQEFQKLFQPWYAFDSCYDIVV